MDPQRKFRQTARPSPRIIHSEGSNPWITNLSPKTFHARSHSSHIQKGELQRSNRWRFSGRIGWTFIETELNALEVGSFSGVWISMEPPKKIFGIGSPFFFLRLKWVKLARKNPFTYMWLYRYIQYMLVLGRYDYTLFSLSLSLIYSLIAQLLQKLTHLPTGHPSILNCANDRLFSPKQPYRSMHWSHTLPTIKPVS